MRSITNEVYHRWYQNLIDQLQDGRSAREIGAAVRAKHCNGCRTKEYGCNWCSLYAWTSEWIELEGDEEYYDIEYYITEHGMTIEAACKAADIDDYYINDWTENPLLIDCYKKAQAAACESNYDRPAEWKEAM